MVFDLREILSRGISILILSSALAALHLWLLTFVEPFLGMQGATVITFSIMGVLLFVTPLWSKLSTSVDQLVLKDRSDERLRLTDAAHDLVTIPDYEGLVQYIGDILKSVLGVECAWLILRDRQGAVRVRGAKRRKGIADQVMAQAALIMQHVTRTGRAFAPYTGLRLFAGRDAAAASRTMADAGLRLAIPLLYKDELLGALAVGPRPDGSGFQEGDIEAFEAFAMSIAVAIRNARRYGESMTDGLTRLYHRKYFIMIVRDVIKGAWHHGYQLSLLMVGVDRFREVNEQHGHVVGDMVLKEIAAELHRLCRETDILSRYGGDEFAILLSEAKNTDGRMVAERLRSRIEALRPEGINVAVSIGTASLGPEGDVNAEEEALIQRGWKALAEAKKQGGNRVV
ncbi:MAG: hypothetical protein A2X56_02935 [Nitrospirae bacterium GWC2_57_13]|jgi:diguanylate cyclase (GGDEF)-like protein|nr:MAG: hypothetical protein A2072_03210 [Nitrospirae bacterium GWC1_57_7]OGW28352.1 MAG: hypothetical protein A2X56_02935 [Nitrospirae bacterium GWC2_57_13]